MQDNIIINKVEIVSRCLARVREEYEAAKENFVTDYSRQDASILNLQRAIQATIDIAAHIVRVKGLAAPKEAQDLFVALYENKMISEKINLRMKKMVGFRNMAVHEYQKLDPNIVVNIIKRNLIDVETFIKEILNAK